MLIVHKHPDTEVPTEYANYPVCDDKSARKNSIVIVDTDHYWCWRNGVEYTYAETKDGKIVHIPLEKCAPLQPATA